MNKTFVIGDIHGNYLGLKQCLERSNFNYNNDTLISLGDVVDGHSQSYEVVEELLKIKNLIAIRGNHDDWFNTWIKTGVNPTNWGQGQYATGQSYLDNILGLGMPFYDYSNGIPIPRINTTVLPDKHIDFFNRIQIPYYIDNQNRLFVHGGFNRHFSIEDQVHNNEDVLMWDRDLWSQALSYKSMTNSIYPDGNPNNDNPKFKMSDNFKEVFIGHTSTQFWSENQPMNAANIWNLDTGGGWLGKVSIMNVDTKEFWQSDESKLLYPNFKGR